MKKGHKDPQKEITKTLKSIRKDVKKTLKKIESKIKETFEPFKQGTNNKIIKFIKKHHPIIILALTLMIFGVGVWQFTVTKTYQNWTREEMSRRPELHLEPREPDFDIEFIDKNIDSKAMIFRCDLVNSGDQIARYIQIRHFLYLYYNSIVSIFVYSQLEEDLVFYNAGKHTADVSMLGWKQAIITRNKKKDKVTDSTICVYVPNVEDTVCFKVTNRNAVSMKIYKNREVIYYDENEGQNYRVKLPYVWLLVDLPPHIDTFYIPYSIDSDRGIFQDTLKIKNPFYKENEQGK